MYGKDIGIPPLPEDPYIVPFHYLPRKPPSLNFYIPNYIPGFDYNGGNYQAIREYPKKVEEAKIEWRKKVDARLAKAKKNFKPLGFLFPMTISPQAAIPSGMTVCCMRATQEISGPPEEIRYWKDILKSETYTVTLESDCPEKTLPHPNRPDDLSYRVLQTPIPLRACFEKHY